MEDEDLDQLLYDFHLESEQRRARLYEIFSSNGFLADPLSWFAAARAQKEALEAILNQPKAGRDAEQHQKALTAWHRLTSEEFDHQQALSRLFDETSQVMALRQLTF